MIDWIRREPTSFREFADKVVVVLMIFAAARGVEPATASAIAVAIGALLTWITRAVTVPTVKLSDATIERAAKMTKADIEKVAEKKAEGL
jgi:hypothetical protein